MIDVTPVMTRQGKTGLDVPNRKAELLTYFSLKKKIFLIYNLSSNCYFEQFNTQVYYFAD